MRAAIYTRVSTDEQIGPDHYSLEAQLRACRQYATDRNWQIVHEYTDEGKSARTGDLAKRPQFKALMHAVEQRAYDVVIVHKLDRFARNLRVLLESLEHLGRVSVSFVSLTEQMDYSSPWGRFALVMLGGLAQLYSDSLSDETRKGKLERKRQGYYNAVIPFGYERVDSKTIIPSTVNAPGLLLAFDLAAQGTSDRDIAQTLNVAGYRSTGNRGTNPWRKDSVRRMLLSRFYLGELPITERKKGQKRSSTIGWLPGNHPALIPEDLWQQAQTARDANRTDKASRSVNGRATRFSLSGLLRCGHCGMSMRTNAFGGKKAPTIYCYGRYQGLGCQQYGRRYVEVENVVGEWIAHLSLDDSTIEQAVQRLRKEQPISIEPEANRRKITAQLERLKDLYELGDIIRQDYMAKRDKLRSELAHLAPESQKRNAMQQIAGHVLTTREAWALASQEERNKLLLPLIEVVVITDQDVTIRPRPDLRELLC